MEAEGAHGRIWTGLGAPLHSQILDSEAHLGRYRKLCSQTTQIFVGGAPKQRENPWMSEYVSEQ